jgi:outer membrane protein OmpA-like peptidoglycan-associated protein
MKVILLIFIFPLFLLWSGFASAQSAQKASLQGINYQATIRDNSGALVKSQGVIFRFSIITGSPTGTVVYMEHTNGAQTNPQAMFATTIGQNEPELGTFSAIDWSGGNTYLKVELFITSTGNIGGGAIPYTDLGTTQFFAVPYALYAAYAANGTAGGQGETGGQGNTGAQGSRGIGITWLGTLTGNPGSPSLNYAYYSSTDKKSYIYDSTGTWQILTEDGHDGATGAAGISITWLGTFATAPTSPTLDQAYYNSADRVSYIYDGSAWQILSQDGIGWNLKTLSYLNNGKLQLITDKNGGDTLTTTQKTWLTTGNNGTDQSTEFIGTLDTSMLIFKTGGAATVNERMRINGKTPGMVINGTVDTSASQGLGVLTVYSGNAPLRTNSDAYLLNGINAYAAGSNAGVYGRNYSVGAGVKGMASAGPGVYGYSDNRSSIGVKGEQMSGNGGYGVFGSTVSPVLSSSNPGAGILGWSQHLNGVGVIGVGTNYDYHVFTNVPIAGAGVMGGANNIGVYGVGLNGSTGVGVAASGNLLLPMVPTAGAGLAATSYNVAVAGFARATTASNPEENRWGGYFEYRTSAAVTGAPYSYGYIAGKVGGVPVGIAMTAPKSTIITDEQNKKRLLYCPEAPEILFQDYGTGELKDGAAHIDLEGLMTKSIRVDEKHPMKVFIQLEGDCNGVFVTNKSAKGFDVKELQHGNSSVPFSWQIIASRADETDPNGDLIPYSDKRFGEAPGPLSIISTGDSATLHMSDPKPAKAELKTEEKAIINTAFSNLQFATAKAEIVTTSLPSLDKMAALLQAHPEWTLTLSGHTDNEGTAAFNQTLSEKRSDAVKQYLVSKGVTASRITTVGYGATKPLTTNDTKEAREKNRRVEMEIFKAKP